MGGGTMHSERAMDTRATQVGARMRMRAPHPYSSEPGTRTRGCAKVLERRLRSREEDARGGCVLEARAALAQCSPSAILDAGASSFRNSRDLLLRRARSVKTSNANCRFSVFSLSLPSFFVQEDLFRPLVIAWTVRIPCPPLSSFFHKLFLKIVHKEEGGIRERAR